ncbi:tetratricopeptide repeat protein [Clavibacter michiganensis]|uniref:tetratricopeptide repeat protein n=1 Tax=Clavibacter michiganensis TaxID=28447 RepID=UPI003EC0E501
MPDAPDAPTRARLLWDEHDRAAALALLKDHLREDPRDAPARLALAGLYRELIAPDQAGRWGIGVPGWTTEVERDRLARMIAHSGIGDHEIPAFLALPPDTALPEELAALAPAIADHRAHFADPARMTRRERKAARYRLPGPHPHVVEDMARELSVAVAEEGLKAVGWILGVVFGLGLLAVWVVALVGGPAAALARWTGIAVVGTLVVICIGCAYGARAARRLERRVDPELGDVDVSSWIIGAILIALVLYALIAEGLRSGALILS